MGTDFNIIYTRFYSKITDDMYMELNQIQTNALLEELLINSLPWFEFPRISLQYDISKQRFKYSLSEEEINIIATYMVLGWFDQQLASIEITRMKYSGSDFKMTSQANHMSKLKELRKEYERIGFHLQRLYKRRKVDKTGKIRSTFGSIMASSVRGGIISNSSSINTNDTPPAEDPDNGDDSWNDMEDLPDPPSTDGSGDGGWDDMGDLLPPSEDGWNSM